MLYKQEEHTPLEWITRKNIVMDMFRGVTYLHAGDPPLVHQDIKS